MLVITFFGPHKVKSFFSDLDRSLQSNNVLSFSADGSENGLPANIVEFWRTNAHRFIPSDPIYAASLKKVNQAAPNLPVFVNSVIPRKLSTFAN
jgi:hypothetical protein